MELVKKALVHKSNNNIVQFVRYGFVSAVALAVDFGSLVLLTELAGVNHLISATIGFIFGLTVNYALSILWVFHSTKQTNNRQAFIIFTIIGIIGLLLTDLIIWLMTDVAGVHYLLSKIASAFIVFIWNFTARKKMVFN